jgi:hypothetical protein
MAGRPYHRRKDDRLFWSGISQDELSCDKAAAPFDEAGRQMDAKWGIGRLVGHVSPETAAKWGSAMAKLNAAIEANDVADTTVRVGVCLRGLAAMDAEAESRNAPKADPRIVEYKSPDGFHFGILLDDSAWAVTEKAHPGLKLVSLQKVAVALERYEAIPGIAEIEKHFPGAQPVMRKPAPRERTELENVLEDEVPF